MNVEKKNKSDDANVTSEVRKIWYAMSTVPSLPCSHYNTHIRTNEKPFELFTIGQNDNDQTLIFFNRTEKKKKYMSKRTLIRISI